MGTARLSTMMARLIVQGPSALTGEERNRLCGRQPELAVVASL